MGPELLIALQIAQGVSSFVGARQAASDQERQNNELRQNTLEARNNDLAAIEARRTEERAAAAQRLQDSQRQALQDRSKALAASAESGQSGLSVNALLSDFLRQSLENEQTIQTNLSNVNSQLDRERLSVNAQAKSRINAAPTVTQPNFLTSALQIGTGVASTIIANKKDQADKKDK